MIGRRMIFENLYKTSNKKKSEYHSRFQRLFIIVQSVDFIPMGISAFG